MNQITIRNLDEPVVLRLKQFAFEEGVPLEETLRRVLSDAVRGTKLRPQDPHFPAPTD